MVGTVVVWVDEPTQIQRLMRRDSLSEAEARERLAAQMPLEEKRRRAQFVLDNSRSLEDTRAQLLALLPRLRPRPNLIAPRTLLVLALVAAAATSVCVLLFFCAFARAADLLLDTCSEDPPSEKKKKRETRGRRANLKYRDGYVHVQ